MKRLALTIAAVAVGLAAFAQDDPVKAALKKLEGAYSMVRGEEGGKPISANVVKSAKLTITGDRHVVQLGEETIRGTHTVNPLETPKSIDATDTMGRFAGKTVKGIYKLVGDELTVSFAPPGEDRPLDFKTQDHPGRLMHVWKRTR